MDNTVYNFLREWVNIIEVQKQDNKESIFDNKESIFKTKEPIQIGPYEFQGLYASEVDTDFKEGEISITFKADYWIDVFDDNFDCKKCIKKIECTECKNKI